MTPRQLEYQRYLQSDHWRELRAVVLARDGAQCVKCQSRFHLQVHHKKYRERFEDSLPEDLITLCEPCHERTHDIHLNPNLNAIGVRVMNRQRLNHQERDFLYQTLRSLDEHERVRARRLLDMDSSNNPPVRCVKPKLRPKFSRKSFKKHLKKLARLRNLQKLYGGPR